METPVYWSVLEHQDWTLHLAATNSGLCCITLPSESLDSLMEWIHRHIPNADILRDDEALRPYAQQLHEYFAGYRTEFTLALDLRGTPFQRSVWLQLKSVPYGETASYSDLAQGVGRPTAVRAVGAANGANPLPIVLPCHRVIGKNGQLTGYRGGLDVKERLLRLESSARPAMS
ncbi:methylated-DNA--[protein]-cysteine S-methyltransferase [Alicyclobacillaceae bacterium I2511]|nr:methylated-DNA--[protein]-cysteine S-methyltransferase [Alicyclobacillaceae bacterium I2511]